MGIPRRSSGWGQRIEAESLCVDADVEEYYTERSACKFIAVEAMLVEATRICTSCLFPLAVEVSMPSSRTV